MGLEHFASRVLATRLARDSRCRSDGHEVCLRRQRVATGKAIQEHRQSENGRPD
jgi:hypothetical protein